MQYLRLPLLLLLALGVFVYTGCEDDDPDLLTQDVLAYDTDPVNAPNGDWQEYGVYFPANLTQQFAGRELEIVNFILAEVPERTVVKIYLAGADDDSPGEQIYERDITSRINASGEIDHRLVTQGFLNGATELTLGSQGIWLGVEVAGTSPVPNFQSVACDNGSNFNINGNRVLIDGIWTDFVSLGGEAVNWNIRGIIAPE